MNVYECATCYYSTKNKKSYILHCKSYKHIEELRSITVFNLKLYKCNICHYGTNQKHSFFAHLNSNYHIIGKGTRY
jgi:hypothetical protein